MTIVRRVGVLTVLFSLLLASGASGHDNSSKHDPKDTTYHFAIKGNVAGMYPGLTKTYAVTLTNPNSFPIVVTSVDVKVDRASRQCGTQNLSSPGLHGNVVVQAHRTASVTVPITMSSKAPSACQGVTFSLTYTGSGRRT